MTKYNGNIKNLLQGVSQQPRRDRRPEQLGVQTNCYSSITRGLGKRPGTTHKLEYANPDFNTAAKYTYDRGDGTERYTIVASEDKLSIIDLISHNTQDITGTPIAYLADQSGLNLDPKDYLKFYTIADTTLVLNKTVLPTMSNPEVSPGWVVCMYCAAANYGKKYMVKIDDVEIASFTTPNVIPLPTDAISKSSTLKNFDVMGRVINGSFSIDCGTVIETGVYSLKGITANLNTLAPGDRVRLDSGILTTSTYMSIESIDYVDRIIVLDPTEAVANSFWQKAGVVATVEPKNVGLAKWCTDNGVTLEISGDNTVVVMSKATGSYNAEVFDDNNNNDLRIIGAVHTNYDELPPKCKTGYKTKITGVDIEKENDYYVQFTRDDPVSGIGRGTWKESIGFDTDRSIDAVSMPHKLVRGSGGVFTFSENDWIDRHSGDDDSNPKPSFIGNPIEDIFTYQERLGFITDENVVASVTYDHFNLFSDSVLQESAADPIDAASADNQVTNLKHATVFDASIMFFSDKAQFIHTSDKAFTSDTFSLTSKAHFQMDTSTAPKASASSVFFPFRSGIHTGIREFKIESLTGATSADPITLHVPEYILGTPRQIETSTDYNILLCTAAALNTIYVYEWYDQGGTRKQAAWHKWEFSQDIVYINIIQDVLYIWTEDTGVFTLLTLDLADHDTIDLDFPLRLDDTQKHQAVDTGDTWVLDVDPTDSTVVVGAENSGIEGAIPAWTEQVNQIVINKIALPNSVGVPYFYVGERYESEAELTTPYVRDTQGSPKTQGRLQIISMGLNCYSTGYLKASIEKKFTPTYTQVYSSKIIDSPLYLLNSSAPLQDPYIRLPIRAQDSRCTTRVSSDSHLPFYITSVDWSGKYTETGRQTI